MHVDCGTQNLGGAVHNASRGRVPVLIFAGLSPMTQQSELPGTRSEHIHWLQDSADQRGMLRGYAKYDHEIRTGRNVKQLVHRAMQIARSEPAGPVYLTAAREVLEEELPPQPAPGRLVGRRSRRPRWRTRSPTRSRTRWRTPAPRWSSPRTWAATLPPCPSWSGCASWRRRGGRVGADGGQLPRRSPAAPRLPVEPPGAESGAGRGGRDPRAGQRRAVDPGPQPPGPRGPHLRHRRRPAQGADAAVVRAGPPVRPGGPRDRRPPAGRPAGPAGAARPGGRPGPRGVGPRQRTTRSARGGPRRAAAARRRDHARVPGGLRQGRRRPRRSRAQRGHQQLPRGQRAPAGQPPGLAPGQRRRVPGLVGRRGRRRQAGRARPHGGEPGRGRVVPVRRAVVGAVDGPALPGSVADGHLRQSGLEDAVAVHAGRASGRERRRRRLRRQLPARGRPAGRGRRGGRRVRAHRDRCRPAAGDAAPGARPRPARPVGRDQRPRGAGLRRRSRHGPADTRRSP